MSRLNRYFSMVMAANLMVASATTADQIADGTTNGYFAEYTVLGPQAGCDAAGMTAYQLDFEASDVPFAVEHALTGQVREHRVEEAITVPETATSDGVVEAILVEPERCYMTVRRGTERIQTGIECSGDRQISDPFALLEAEDTTLSISGQAMVCVSLTGFEVLGGSWTADLDNGPEQVSHSGTSFVPSLPSCDDTQHALPFVQLNHVMRGIMGNPAEWGRYRIREDEATAAGFHLSLNKIPLSSDGSIASRFTVQASAYFFPTFAGEADCPNNICRVPLSGGWWAPRPNRLTCE